jgi:hypothetical protein
MCFVKYWNRITSDTTIFCWSNMLQAVRSWVRYIIRTLNFFFSIYVILPTALRPEVYSASNWKECLKKKYIFFWRVDHGRSLWLAASPLSVKRLSIQRGILNISRRYSPPQSVRLQLYLLYLYVHETVISAVTIKRANLWDVGLCSPAELHLIFGAKCCLNLQEKGVTLIAVCFVPSSCWVYC